MRILVADDHPVVRSGLRRLLASMPETDIVEAATGPEVLTTVRRTLPDLIVLDINLPGVGGLELLRRLTAHDPGVRIVVFSMHAELIYATQALRAGALGYVTKTAPPEEILEAIRRVGAGETYIDRALAQELAVQNVVPRGETMLPPLSARELELLRLLGAGHSLAGMAAATGVSYKTVANSLSLLKARLGIATTPELIRLAIKSGISP